jgi:hypothetical protein
MQIDLSLETRLKIQELESQGYEINFFTEERNFKTTGPYTAYFAEIKKDGQLVWKQFSRKLDTTITIWKYDQEWHRSLREKYG